MGALCFGYRESLSDDFTNSNKVGFLHQNAFADFRTTGNTTLTTLIS